MTAFIASAGLLATIVLTLLLRPLWRTARGVALGVAGMTLLSTALLYKLVGTPQALDPAALRAPRTLDEAIHQLQTALAHDPAQAEGWRLLATAYKRKGEATQARDALAKAATLAPDNPDILTEAAQARALAAPEHVFDAQANAMLQRALKLEPRHQRARWLLGVSQRQAGKNAEAAATWEPLLQQVSSDTQASLRSEINKARSAAGLPMLPAAETVPAALTVKLALTPALAQQLPTTASVFVFARKPGGPPMPIAAEKHPASALPLTITLNDADSPMPTMKLSQVHDIELIARLSRDGNAERGDGDIETTPLRIKLPATTPVTLVIGKP